MIGGNTELTLKREIGVSTNAIGERISTVATVTTLTGWLDLLTQDTKRTTFDAKIEESTHIFVCDYKKLSADAEDCTALVDEKLYDVMLIDDPMGMHEQLEIYLKYTGGQ